jgi:lysophospholipase L1-like esterase
MKKTILTYGDSYTHGKVPGAPKRYSREENFVGVLEKELGEDFRIIDEGLRARTLSGENTFFPERDGLAQFGPILGSHLPLDLICIFLGTNDCNKTSSKSDEEIYQALLEYKNKIEEWCKNLIIEKIPKVMIIAPPVIRGDQVILDKVISGIFDAESEEKSKRLAPIYEKFCNENGCEFFNSATYVKTSDGEGIHLDLENNASLGKVLAREIKNFYF